MKHRTGYLFKRGSNYYLRWTVSGQHFTKSLRDENDQPITDKKKAESAKEKVMAAMSVADEREVWQSMAQRVDNLTNRIGEIKAELEPPLDFARAWGAFHDSAARAEMRTGKETLENYERQFEHFGKWIAAGNAEVKTLRDVTLAMAKAYRKHLAVSGRSPNTVNKYLAALELIWRVLRKEAQLGDNPWTNDTVGRETLDTTGRIAFTAEEVTRICDRASDDMRSLFKIAAMTGLRLKDCCLLRWADVDLNAMEIRRVPAKTKRFGHGNVIIPIPSPLFRLLNSLAKDGTGYVLPAMAKRYQEHKRELIGDIQRHIEGCGIQTRGEAESSNRRAPTLKGFHSFRHFFVSATLQGGASMLRVQKMVGHSSAWMTDKYSHVLDLAESRKAVGLLANVVENGKADKTSPEAILAKLRAIISGLTPENLDAKRTEMLALIPTTAQPPI